MGKKKKELLDNVEQQTLNAQRLNSTLNKVK